MSPINSPTNKTKPCPAATAQPPASPSIHQPWRSMRSAPKSRPSIPNLSHGIKQWAGSWHPMPTAIDRVRVVMPARWTATRSESKTANPEPSKSPARFTSARNHSRCPAEKHYKSSPEPPFPMAFMSSSNAKMSPNSPAASNSPINSSNRSSPA